MVKSTFGSDGCRNLLLLVVKDDRSKKRICHFTHLHSRVNDVNGTNDEEGLAFFYLTTVIKDGQG